MQAAPLARRAPQGKPQAKPQGSPWSLPALAAVLPVLLLGALLWAVPAAQAAGAVVAKGRHVSIEYTLSLDDGSVPFSNVGQKPLTYVQGQGQILPALEQALAGMKPGESKEVVLSPEQGFGPVDPKAFVTVPKDRIPKEARKVGTVLVARDPRGHSIPVRVKAIKGDQVVLDYNHPLAGQRLHFKVKVLSVK
ncbi:MAG: peptidylprolyl isomerase [Gammaproteobacteria bacterium]|nr:MAG: peptidylprolyl isomerase [Gammaproteobacteria bacterium]